MDLNILNSGTVDSKTFLNPVCNTLTCDVLTCNSLVLEYDIFNINFNGQAPLTANLTNPCTTTTIDSINMDLATNVYTAPNDIYLFVSLQLSLYYTPASTSFSSTTTINVNGVPTSFSSGLTKQIGGEQGRFPQTCTGVLDLVAGDTVSISIITAGAVGGTNYGNVSFSGYVI